MAVGNQSLHVPVLRVCRLLESPKQGNLQKCSRECSRECSQKSGCSHECSRECSRGWSSCCSPQKEPLESTLGSTPDSTPFSESTPESTLGRTFGGFLVLGSLEVDRHSTLVHNTKHVGSGRYGLTVRTFLSCVVDTLWRGVTPVS